MRTPSARIRRLAWFLVALACLVAAAHLLVTGFRLFTRTSLEGRVSLVVWLGMLIVGAVIAFRRSRQP